MLDKLYTNIGGKIKNWAKWIFIVEAISVISSAIVLLVKEDFLYGLLCLIVGPIVAFVSTWLLYGFGEMIEDLGLLRQKLVGEKEEMPLFSHLPKPTMKKVQVTPKKQANPAPTSDVQAQRRKAWDRWNDADSSYGHCDLCDQKQFLLYVEFEDDEGTHKKNLCYDCFIRRDCRPIDGK